MWQLFLSAIAGNFFDAWGVNFFRERERPGGGGGRKAERNYGDGRSLMRPLREIREERRKVYGNKAAQNTVVVRAKQDSGQAKAGQSSRPFCLTVAA